ncbi:SWI/SNF complex subunit SWI3D-like isoform X2 [Phragmites australis]|uniref:SWI/SNF complex subunit SWI3D-like isoform X2 n=1 Tax=Phragmites australis TaxID=29695 RepID=UPI002D79752C|nr:SWI/SNF complex subunit SWI3D-like isoform X2 [Phragmites australis]
MESKPSSAAHGDAPAAEAPRRRAGGGKRKSAGSSFTPSKRQAKERNAAFHVPPHLLHSGPLTRAARQSPHKLAGTAPEAGSASPAAAAGAGGAKVEGGAIRAEGEETSAEELPLVDEVFDAVRSRGAGVHVVPTFAGWFSWKEIHPVEKQTLPSFFNGKSEKRTPEVYLEIRNSIMMKFHANPQLQLESKDLAQLSIGEVDARQEVLEFLDHWGLINFHPFPPAGQEESKPEESHNNSHDEEKASLIEQLFKFESVQSYMIPLPKKGDVEAPAPLPSLFPDPVLVEDVVAAAEPSVEYHCNSCSVDCSRKRYHCRTQADFDLCCDCYNEGKFDTGMAKTDFILMDSAEVSGASGTSWTDEETLLLLEGLEIFGGKWAEIAEHVATKTKAQCMLHFLQMQIEDRFHDDEEIHQNIPENTEQALTEKGTAETPEKMEVEDKSEGKDSADERPSEKTEGNWKEAKTEDASAVENKNTQNSDGKDSVASPNTEEPKQSSDAHTTVKENSAEVGTSGEKLSNVAIDILKSAFEAVGHSPEHEGSFADVGNPVMALAAFLADLVEDDNATTSCRSSLKAISEVSPALQLASRHCFILEDPSNDLKGICFSVSNKNTDGDQTKDEDMTQNLIDTEKKGINEKEDNALSVEKKNNSAISPNDHQESDNKNMSCDDCPLVGPKTNNAEESGDPTALVDKSSSGNTKDVVAGSNTGASNPKLGKEKPSAEGKASDDSSLEGQVEPSKTEDAVTTPATFQEQKQSQTMENGNTEEPNGIESVVANEVKGPIVTANRIDSLTRLKRAVATAISAAAVKSKFLAEQEEYQIRRLTALMIEKLFQKIEVKMSLFAEIEQVVLRTKEYTEKTRKKLLMERNAIIAARMGALPSRPNQPGVAGNRLPPGYGNPVVRPPNAMRRPSS